MSLSHRKISAESKRFLNSLINFEVNKNSNENDHAIIFFILIINVHEQQLHILNACEAKEKNRHLVVRCDDATMSACGNFVFFSVSPHFVCEIFQRACAPKYIRKTKNMRTTCVYTNKHT